MYDTPRLYRNVIKLCSIDDHVDAFQTGNCNHVVMMGLARMSESSSVQLYLIIRIPGCSLVLWLGPSTHRNGQAWSSTREHVMFKKNVMFGS